MYFSLAMIRLISSLVHFKSPVAVGTLSSINSLAMMPVPLPSRYSLNIRLTIHDCLGLMTNWPSLSTEYSLRIFYDLQILVPPGIDT